MRVGQVQTGCGLWLVAIPQGFRIFGNRGGNEALLVDLFITQVDASQCQ
jgi:hypothetical protein